MVPEKTQETADCLPKSQSKSGMTQLDSPGMVDSMNCQKENQSIGPDNLPASDCQENLETLRVQSSEKQVCDTVVSPAPDEDVPDISSQPCVNLVESDRVYTELTSNAEETLIREGNDRTSHDADAIMDQDIPVEFAFPFPDPASTLDIQGSARSSDQGAHGTCSPLSSSVNHLEVVHEGGVQSPNLSYGRSIVNALADTSLPNNPMGHNPQIQDFHLFSDPYEYELEKLRREEGNLRKNFEETTSELMAELERKMAEARSEYDRKSKEIDVAYNAKAMEEETNRNLVSMSSLLANGFMSKFTDKSAAVRAARSSQHSIQQQQAVETNTHMNSTAPPPRPSPNAPIPNPSGPLSHFPHCNTAQPRPISQQEVAEFITLMNSTATPRPSVTAANVPIPNPSGPLSHSPHCNTTQPRPISQQAVAESNTLMNSTAPPPRHSVAAPDAPIPNPPGPLSHFPRCSTTQPRPISQQAVTESNTLMNSSAPPPRPSVTAEALPLHLPRCNTPQTRPPPLIPNITPSSSSPTVYGTVRGPAPHLQRFRPSRAPNTTAASTTYPRKLVQEKKQQQGNSIDDLVCLSDDDD